MSHRIIISSAFANVFSTPDVREQMTPAQCACVDEILQSPEPTVEQIRELAHRAVQVYAKPDE